MQKIVVIIISFTILFQSFNFEVSDFNRLPNLASHYLSHLESGDNFIDFISKHYGNQANSHNNEHKEHRKLPFKHNYLKSHFQNFYTLCSHNIFISFEETLFREHQFAYAERTSIIYLNNLLQPPQKLT